MSYFDRQGIPEDALKVQPQEAKQKQDDVGDDEKDEDQDNEEDSISEGNDNNIFEEAVERLRSYSFVSIGVDGQTFEMHALV
jgi:hypothetical protein